MGIVSQTVRGEIRRTTVDVTCPSHSVENGDLMDQNIQSGLIARAIDDSVDKHFKGVPGGADVFYRGPGEGSEARPDGNMTNHITTSDNK